MLRPFTSMSRLVVALAVSVLVTGGLVATPSPVASIGCTLSGGGTIGNPYLVASASDLLQLTGDAPECSLAAMYEQTADIDLSGVVWPGIGSFLDDRAFSGSYSGAGHEITGLGTPARPAVTGLFDLVAGGEVLNLSVQVHIAPETAGADPGEWSFIGGIAGYVSDGGVLRDVSVSGIIAGVTAGANASSYLGGAVGTLADSRLERAAAHVDVAGEAFVGGLVGIVAAGAGSASITDSHALGQVEGTDFAIGGLLGWASRCSGSGLDIDRSYARGAVAGPDDSTAGFIGGFATGDECEDVEGEFTVAPTFSASFWDTGTSGQADGSTAAVAGAGTLEGRTTAQMQRRSTFSEAGWSIVDAWEDPTTTRSIWGICPAANDGSPFLLSQFATDPCTGYVALRPGRFMDTRNPGSPTIDGQAQGIGTLEPGNTYQLRVGGRGNVPNTAQAVAFNLTIVGAQGNGYATVWPCGDNIPNASTINFVDINTIANATITKLGTNNALCIRVEQAPADVLIDITGYFP